MILGGDPVATVYPETSCVSACVTDRLDPASVYRRGLSQEWWKTQSGQHELFISAEVLAELSQPSFSGAHEALSLIEEIPLLTIDKVLSGEATGTSIYSNGT